MASDGNDPEPEKAEASAGTVGDYLEDTQFQCCVCLDILYKPVVLACGHISCFWCVHKTMHGLRESHCPVCRQPFKHFPSICQLLHHLLLKLEPVEYERRGKEVLEEEKRMETYSPQIIEFYNFKNNEIGKDGKNKLEDGKIIPPQETPCNSSIVNEHSKKIKLEDVSCPLCKEMLYEPAVLNCGHGKFKIFDQKIFLLVLDILTYVGFVKVYCVSCLSSLNEETLKCQVCGGFHPGDIPNVCLDLDHFLEEYFPSEYESRGVKVQFEKRRFNHEASSSRTSSTKESSRAHHYDDMSDVHFGVGCDSCGVYPIRGKRYKCQDCTELIGFDLCEACYSSSLNLPGRFNQQHTPDHRMELDDTNIVHRLMRFHVIPEEGPVDVMLQNVVFNPAAMAEILAGDQEMEGNNEEAVVAPDAMIHIVIDDEEMEDNEEQDQPL